MSSHNDEHRTTPSTKSSLQGVNALAIDAIINIADIVESVHHRVNKMAGISGHPSKERTSGLTGAIYRGVRNVAQLVGNTLDGPLGALNGAFKSDSTSSSAKAMQAALNGVLGDYLHKQDNPLAIQMKLTQHGKPVSEKALTQVLEHAIAHHDGKVLLLVHGLCMNDDQWHREGHNHGAALAHELGYCPLYLHYNSGQHVSFNGEQLAMQLDALQAAISEEISVDIVAHSMGGLVTRSAIHYAQEQQQSWPNIIRKIVFLGTPHHGAPLEKTGKWLDFLLGKHPYTVPFTKLVQIRSSGITDLRQGNITADDEKPRGQFDFVRDKRKPVPLPKNIHSYAIAASVTQSSKLHVIDLVGDGLVPIDSALGRHSNKAHTLRFKPDNLAHFAAHNHMQLLSSQEVYAKLKDWLG